MFLAFSMNDRLPISQNFPETDNSVLWHATEMRSGSYWSLEHVLSRRIQRVLALICQMFPKMDNSVKEHATDMR